MLTCVWLTCVADCASQMYLLFVVTMLVPSLKLLVLVLELGRLKWSKVKDTTNVTPQRCGLQFPVRADVDRAYAIDEPKGCPQNSLQDKNMFGRTRKSYLSRLVSTV